MNPLLLAGLVGGGIYLLAKRAHAVPSYQATRDTANDPRATLSGPDGSQSTAGYGQALSAFPAVGNGGPSGSTQTAANVSRDPGWAPSAPAPTTSGTSRLFTQTFQAPRPLVRTKCGSCAETQQSIQSAIAGLAPDLRF